MPPAPHWPLRRQGAWSTKARVPNFQERGCCPRWRPPRSGVRDNAQRKRGARGVLVHRTLVGSPFRFREQRSSVWRVQLVGPEDGLAGLPCFHLWSRMEVPPLPVAGEGALSQYLPHWFGPKKCLVSFTPGFFEDSSPYFFWNKLYVFILGLVSFGFTIPVPRAPPPPPFSSFSPLEALFP